ncbi:unnamed protein product, partial [Durusdinium trenchii]
RRSVVIDLGCHAGGWSQIILERINREGFVVGVDKVLIEPLENHHFVQGDIQHAATIRKVEELLGGRQANLVLADLAEHLGHQSAGEEDKCKP